MTILGTWLGAATLVAAAHWRLDVLSVSGGAVAVIATIAAAAYVYVHFCAHDAGITHALGVGIAWLVLTIVTEIAVTTRLGHPWSGLLGSPAHPLLRNLFLFVWIFAPAVFAHGDGESLA